MKRCPQCNRVENDDTLAFCRADGTSLISDSASFSGDVGTAKFGSGAMSSEIETSILPHTSTAPAINRPTAPTTVLPAAQPQSTTRELTKPRRKAVIVLTLLFVAVAAAIVIGGYLYYSRNSSTAIELMVPAAVLLRARQKSPSPMIPATSARTTMTATILCRLIPVTTYSALESTGGIDANSDRVSYPVPNTPRPSRQRRVV